MRRPGFTLIELLVVVAIMIVVTGGGLATYTRLRDNRVIQQDAKTVEAALREAQVKALSGDKPPGCGAAILQGYTVNLDTDFVEVVADCPGGSPAAARYDLTGSTIFAYETSISFSSVRGGATATFVEVCSETQQYLISVGAGGDITQPERVSSECGNNVPEPTPLPQLPQGTTPTPTSTPSVSPTPTPTPGGPVTFYRDCYYSGIEAGFYPGTYFEADLLARGLDPNTVKSMKIPNGYEVVLYHDQADSGYRTSSSSSCSSRISPLYKLDVRTR